MAFACAAVPTEQKGIVGHIGASFCNLLGGSQGKGIFCIGNKCCEGIVFNSGRCGGIRAHHKILLALIGSFLLHMRERPCLRVPQGGLLVYYLRKLFVGKAAGKRLFKKIALLLVEPRGKIKVGKADG